MWLSYALEICKGNKTYIVGCRGVSLVQEVPQGQGTVGGLNTEHWNTEHIGIPNVLKFCFSMVQKQDRYHFVQISNGPDHWKTELLASLHQFFK